MSKLEKLQEQFGKLQAQLDAANDKNWERVREGKQPLKSLYSLTKRYEAAEQKLNAAKQEQGNQ